MKAKILDPKFKYTSAAATNVQETWRKFGRRPISEMPTMRSLDTGKSDSSNERVSPKIQRVR